MPRHLYAAVRAVLFGTIHCVSLEPGLAWPSVTLVCLSDKIDGHQTAERKLTSYWSEEVSAGL